MSSGFDVHTDEDGDPGFCRRLDADGFYGCNKDGHRCTFKMWDLHGITFLVSGASLMLWARKQYALGTTGFYVGDMMIIFPVHMQLLIAQGATSLWQGLLYVASRYAMIYRHNGTIEVLSIWANIASFSMSHFVTDGTTMLLLSSGLGQRAMTRAFLVGLGVGLFVAATYAISTSDAAGYSVFPHRATNVSFDWMRDGLLLVLYVALWLAPGNGCNAGNGRLLFAISRRPALTYWARFWGLLKALSMAMMLLMDRGVDAAFCGYHAVLFFAFTCKIWIAYEAFAIECKWWHGINVKPRGMCVPWGAGKKPRVSLSKNLQEVESALLPEGEEELWSKDTESALHAAEKQLEDRYKQVSLDQSITRPFQTLALSAASALGMTQALEGSKGPRSAVPLIDFSRVRLVKPDRLLGSGSSARVYEGKWCGKVVAVKILFTMELTPEEISRTCLEASLLHRLQKASPHIVRFHGVCVLPPSLCVVLEICSEASLFNLLEKKANKHKGTDKGTTGGEASLSWKHQLELALGACRGVAALVAALPGHSHNDVKSHNFLVHCPTAAARLRDGPDDWMPAVISARDASRDALHYIVKLSDLEFVSEGVTPAHLKGDVGTPNWTAPEVLCGTSAVSPASDVFGLAMVLFEVASGGEVPFGTSAAPHEVSRAIQDGKRPAFPAPGGGGGGGVGGGGEGIGAPHAPPSGLARGFRALVSDALERAQGEQYRDLVSEAWAQDPRQRPTASAMAASLNRILVAGRTSSMQSIATGDRPPSAMYGY